MLGPDCVLVQRLPEGGYRCPDSDALALLARTVFDDDTRLRRLPLVLSGIVAALDRGDLVKAQLLGLEIPIDRLDEPRLQRLGRAADLLKDGFDPNQLRDEHGRWAREGGAGTRTTPSVPKASLLRRLTPAALRSLAGLAARIVAAGALEATAFLGIIFIPTNRSLISQGPVADRPDLRYEYDQGAATLRLYQQDGDRRSIVFQGRPDADGIIRDNDGHAVGRKLGDSVVMLDPDALPGAGAGSPRGPGGDKPKLCPDPTEESTEGRKDRSIEYQAYVSGLPPGLDVKLTDPATGKDVKFDGCRESDGTMLEAKGPGYLEHLRSDRPIPWHNMEADFDEQAERQSRSALASGRQVEWHFADAEVAEHFRKRWEGRFANMTLIHTPMPGEP